MRPDARREARSRVVRAQTKDPIARVGEKRRRVGGMSDGIFVRWYYNLDSRVRIVRNSTSMVYNVVDVCERSRPRRLFLTRSSLDAAEFRNRDAEALELLQNSFIVDGWKLGETGG